MHESFGIQHLLDYMNIMKLKIAQVEHEREVIELAFHGSYGQWRMIVGFQQEGDVRKLMLIVPHVASLKREKREECLEALMAVNFRIAMGKFGLDLDDGEVRLEETVPIANNTLTFEQFQLAFGALMQTMAIYHNLLPRILQENISVQEAIRACERDFFQSNQSEKPLSQPAPVSRETSPEPGHGSDLDVDDVLAEVTRMLREKKE